jgi:GNAT superfamily N-acetyltransferase
MATQHAEQVLLRPMAAGDLEAAAELSLEQGWPHRIEDWKLFCDIGEGIVAERDGTILGTIMAWKFGADMATLGMVIVTNAAQGMGLGTRLLTAMLDRLDGRTVILNATTEGLPLYRKFGFIETGRVFQHQGPAPVVPLAELQPGERIRPIGGADDCLGHMYSEADGIDREALFGIIAKRGRTVVLTREDQPVGFAMLRRFGRGWSVAPVVAPDLGGAKALVSHWLAAKAGRFCRLDVTEAGGLAPWLEELGLPCVGTVTTMVRGTAQRPAGAAKTFALTGQALG